MLIAATLIAYASCLHSAPEAGQFSRYRAALGGSMLSIVPVDGAEFIPLQHFDISIELHKLISSQELDSISYPDVSKISATINGSPLETTFQKTFVAENWNFTYHIDAQSRDLKIKTHVAVTRLSLRSVFFQSPGSYVVVVEIGSEYVRAEFIVRSIGSRQVRNMVLFIGDGMAPTMMNAARYLSRETRFGKFGSNFLNIDKLGTLGKMTTNGLDSIITDSANSAAAYTSGQKGWVNTLNVYADTSSDTMDDPKVETIAEYIRQNRPGMCIGIVTTAEIQDATPAAVYSHTRTREDKAWINDQQINGFRHKNISWDPPAVRADVLMGGGGKYFCASKTNGTLTKDCSPLNGQDYYQLYAGTGYTVIKTKTELDNHSGEGPLVGIFHTSHIDSWLDRSVYPENMQLNHKHPDGSGSSATDIPGLEDMTMKAIEIMSNNPKCSDGFWMLVEAATIDKEMHAMDYDRGLADLLELDRTVKRVNDWAIKNAAIHGETGIIVTADHSQAYDVFGTVDTKYFNSQPTDDSAKAPGLSEPEQRLQIQKRLAVGEYEGAGWPNLVNDEHGMPTRWDNQYRLAQGKVDKTQHRENYQLSRVPDASKSPMGRLLTVRDPRLSDIFGMDIGVENPLITDGLRVSPNSAVTATSTVHSIQAVDLFCGGPVGFRILCSRIMDNTELFFIMSEGLGLGNGNNEAWVESSSCSSFNWITFATVAFLFIV